MRKKSRITNKLIVFDMDGKELDDIELNKDIFNGKVNKPLIYQALLMYRANIRQGTASTKTRGMVSGGGRKPWRQKGTGRARTSSIRNPIWRGGGTIFGPQPRDYSYKLPKKARKLALISCFNAKMRENKLMAIEELSIKEPKTKLVSLILKNLKIKDRALFLVDKCDRNLYLAGRNVKNFNMKNVSDVNTYDLLTTDVVILTRKAIEFLNNIRIDK